MDPTMMSSTREWKFTQWFRKSPNNEAAGEQIAEDSFDITAVEFDKTGRFLATGDNSGNVVVLQNDPQQARERDELVRYIFHCEFQSHHVEFDYVSSQPIPERIHSIKWGPVTNDSLYLLNTNCKHIKLWKITEREPFHFVNLNIDRSNEAPALDAQGIPIHLPRLEHTKQTIDVLKIPKYVRDEKCVITGLKGWYPYEGHIPPITHLAVMADNENFISADYFKLNLWNFYRTDTCYNVADFLPKDGAPLQEVITAIDRHPLYSNLFIHGSNLGKIRLCDMRERALAEKPSKQFNSMRKDRPGQTAADLKHDEEDQQSLFDEVTSGVAGALFSKGGRYIVSRDYMTVKIWDTRYEKRPFETFYVHEYLREEMFELYKTEQLADAFGLGLSSKGNIVTGTYSNYFHLFELSERRDVFIHASREPETVSPISQHNKRRDVSYTGPKRNQSQKKRGLFGRFGGGKKKVVEEEEPVIEEKVDDYPLKMDFDSIEFDKKVLDCAWHPTTDAVAITAQNSLFIYSK